MAIPTVQSLLYPVTRLLCGGNSVSTQEIVEAIGSEFKLSPDEQAQTLSNRSTSVIANRVHWALVHLQQHKFITRVTRGRYQITDTGRDYLDKGHSDIRLKSDEKNPAPPLVDQTENTRSSASYIANNLDPVSTMTAAESSINSSLRLQILERIIESSPIFFEHLIALLAVGLGYGGGRNDAVRVVGRGGDGGIDVEIDQDPLGIEKIYLQAKRYRLGNNVGDGIVRDFMGALHLRNAKRGVIVCTSSFTISAKTSAERLGIVLIDGEKLASLLIQHNIGVRVEHIFYVKRIDEDFFI